MRATSRQAVKTLVPDEVYTDRQEFIDYLYHYALDLLRGLIKGDVISPAKRAIMLPRAISDHDNTTIAVFLDEFQNTRLPHYQFDLVEYFHESVESPTCPHFVTGSAMTILSQDILGRGALFGRFRSHPIEALSMYWGAELALRVAHHYHAELSELVAPVVADRCGGNPFIRTFAK